MPALLAFDVRPFAAEVALLDATWQDYPQWEPEDTWVAYHAPSLINQDSPPYPGVVVATSDLARPDDRRSVRVEVWTADEPTGLHCVHETVLVVSSHHGVYVGTGGAPRGRSEQLTLPAGEYPLRVLVDASRPDQVTRVVFGFGPHRARQRPHSPTAD